MTVLDSSEQPRLVARFVTAVTAASSRVATFIRSWRWQLATAALVLTFVGYYIRPLEKIAPLQAEDVALAWNQSIARLGILPVFPPEEDFHVGDVWAVIAEADDEADEQRPLLGKSVRLAHIDLRSELKAARVNQPTFAETAETKAGEQFRRQSRLEEARTKDDAEKIQLSLAAFPGITVTHRGSYSGALGTAAVGLGAARDQTNVEEIRIPVAETYGVPALSAFYRLNEWCQAERTRIYCSDAFIRRVLAFAVGNRVEDKRADGKYVSRLQLRLVTRVFLTREIQHRKFQNLGRGGSAGLPAAGGALPTPRTDSSEPLQPLSARTGEAVSSIQQATKVGRSNELSAVQGDGSEIQLREVFQRPVVFGYRAITIRIEAEIAAKGATK